MTDPDLQRAGPREMRLRYAGRCRECDAELARGTQAVYDPGSKTVSCLACVGTEGAAPPVPSEPEKPVVTDTSPGIAGSSARREHERRVTAREERIRRKHPRIGGLILALSDDPQTTQAWATGAVGEEKLGRRLNALTSPLVRVLHDRGIPGSRTNLDHLVVCPTGVLVVDAKRYQGRPHRAVEGGLFTPRTEKLLVGRRDCTRLVDAGLKQARLVQEALKDDTVPVRSVLCFVEADWPSLGGDFVIRGVSVTWPRKLASVITTAGLLDETQIADLHRRLATAFPPA